MHDVISDAWREVKARPHGPLAFRFYLQPTMAALFAIREGIRDAKAGRPAYLETLVLRRSERKRLLREGWHSVGRVVLFALAIDLIYQIVVLKAFTPVQAIVIAFVLAVVPYVILRGPVDRLLRRQHRGGWRHV